MSENVVKLCKKCGVGFALSKGFCSACRKKGYGKYEAKKGSDIPFKIGYCPYETEAFLKTWQGRQPDPVLGF